MKYFTATMHSKIIWGVKSKSKTLKGLNKEKKANQTPNNRGVLRQAISKV